MTFYDAMTAYRYADDLKYRGMKDVNVVSGRDSLGDPIYTVTWTE